MTTFEISDRCGVDEDLGHVHPIPEARNVRKRQEYDVMIQFIMNGIARIGHISSPKAV